MMSTAVIVLLFAVGLAARVLSTATHVVGKRGVSWMLTGLALITWCVATIASMLSSSRIGSLSSRLGLIVVLLGLAGVVGLLAWRASDSPRFRDLSLGQWVVLLVRSLAPLIGLWLGVAVVVAVV